MKKRILVFSIFAIILIVIIYNLYPSRKIVLSTRYDISNCEYKNIVNAKIITSEIDLSNKKVNINKTLLNDIDTRIYLNSIYIDDINRVVITIKGKSKWHFLKGNCLSILKVNKSNNNYLYNGAPIHFKITDENNKTIQYLQAGYGPGEMISIILSKDIFQNSKSINIEISGFNILQYTRKSILGIN